MNNVSELKVITQTKKLTAYVIAITEKSPKKFRRVFVERMQNYCINCLENLVIANSTQMTTPKNKEKRAEAQHDSYMQLKLLEYISMIALENQCILTKQYEQINIQINDCLNLLVAWRKSDVDRNSTKK